MRQRAADDLAEAEVGLEPCRPRTSSKAKTGRGPDERARASQGTTRSANRRVTAIFSSSGRGRRSVVPTTVSRLRRHHGQVDRPPCRRRAGRPGPAGPAVASAARLPAERRAADQVDHDVDPLRRRSAATTAAKSSSEVSMATSSPNRPARSSLRRSARCRRRCSPSRERAAGRRADAAADGVDQDPLARPRRPCVGPASCAVRKTSGTAAASSKIQVRGDRHGHPLGVTPRIRPSPRRRRSRRPGRRPSARP